MLNTDCKCIVWIVLSVLPLNKGFPGGSVGTEHACNAGDTGLILGWGRSPEEGNGNQTNSNILAWRISWTEEPGGLQSMSLQSWTWLKQLSTSLNKTVYFPNLLWPVVKNKESGCDIWIESLRPSNSASSANSRLNPYYEITQLCDGFVQFAIFISVIFPFFLHSYPTVSTLLKNLTE